MDGILTRLKVKTHIQDVLDHDENDLHTRRTDKKTGLMDGNALNKNINY